MSSEVAVFTDDVDLTEIGRWARDANDIAKMAAKLTETSFVPASYNGKPAEATAAILTGMEVGLKPMAALRSIVVINGTPGLTAQALRGLVQSRGHRIWVEESTSQRAIVKGIRKGEDQVQTSVWDVARATAAGLMSKAMYKSQPQSMFVARASSEICRLIGSDVIMGLAYSVEELSDEVEPQPEPAKPRATRKAQRAPLEVTRGTEPDPDGFEKADELAGGPMDDPEAIAGLSAAAVDEQLAAEAKAKAEKEFSERPPLEEPAVDWAPPAEDEAPPQEPV